MAAEFSAENIAELSQRVVQWLPRWELAPQTSVRLLNVSENATFLVSDPSGRELVLRVHRSGYSSAAEINSEIAWILALRREQIIDTAAPVLGVDGHAVQTFACGAGRAPRLAVAFERLPGSEPCAADAPRWFGRLGELTARLHSHARSWTLPPGFVRKRWDADAMLGSRALWGSWRAGVGLDAAGLAVLEAAEASIRRRLQRFGATRENFGLVHADLRLANLLADESGLRIIDFDDCGFGWFVYDFATAVSFIEHERGVPALLAAWCNGYRRAAPLSVEVENEISTFVVLRRILLTAWVASHGDAPFACEHGAAFTRGTVTLADDWLHAACDYARTKRKYPMTADTLKTSTHERDLILTRLIDASPGKVFSAWTEPAQLKLWFAPLPWTTPVVEADVRPGGSSLIVMRAEDGTDFPYRGVYLEVVKDQRLVFTNAYTKAWEPAAKPFTTVILTFEPHAGMTKYTALVRHWSVEDREAHEKMGFHKGWPVCAQQLADLVETRLAPPAPHERG